MLKHLKIRGTKIRELPKAIGKLENLERLAYDGSRNMDMSLPPKLWELDISCDDPRSLTLPPQLVVLYLSCDDPQSLTLPPQLSSLHLSCDDVGSIPRLPLGLHALELIGIKSPIAQPLPSKVRCLCSFTLTKWDSREIVIEQLECLNYLSLYDCKSLEILDLSSLGRVKDLSIETCPQLVEIRDLGEKESLKKLDIRTCSSIERLPKLSKLYELKTFCVGDCRSLQCLPDLPNSTESSPEPWLCLTHCESLQGAVPNGWNREIHACPLLGESDEDFDDCQFCEETKPGRRSKRRTIWG